MDIDADPAWRRALRFVEQRSSGPALDRSLRVTVHFHPDRLVGDLPLLAVLARDGRYRSQFETGTSNGGLTAHPGGDRWHWEQRMFGRAYDEALPSERPVYGSLDHRHRDVGGSIRFGSAHLVLTEAVLERTTFCWPDSTFDPVAFGTAGRMRLAGLADVAGHDLLDDYVEAHVHGQVVLARDVEAVVLDPAHRGTEVEAAAAGLAVPVRWHGGRRLSADRLARHADYRGPEVVDTGRAIAEDGWLDARVVGRAAATGQHDPQLLKRVWHCVARFGTAVEPTGGGPEDAGPVRSDEGEPTAG